MSAEHESSTQASFSINLELCTFRTTKMDLSCREPTCSFDLYKKKRSTKNEIDPADAYRGGVNRVRETVAPVEDKSRALRKASNIRLSISVPETIGPRRAGNEPQSPDTIKSTTILPLPTSNIQSQAGTKRTTSDYLSLVVGLSIRKRRCS